ncbi:hypothetical protein DYD21_13350 [Rhodohalobacter sp. SW132]|uniref:toxin-antitoxin system YwqK family antitoxin n=1 Tax=Rhodohalobacter sp. SW132 TaxID=2293433 RepID=UPI000E25C25F|nr:hypothetical protein [Rhodohalobacter sp. SW132]REL32808.1 hypothetical protein DYD21_13350 [Rhodohalobacter sp. SW132]
MKPLSSLLIILLLLTACSQEETFEKTSYRVADIFPEISLSDEFNLYVDETAQPANGHYTSSYQNGSTLADITFREGMISEGKIFRSDGLQEVSYTTENERMKLTFYKENGEPHLVSVYGDDMSDRREFHAWYENGVRSIESDETNYKMWYENGLPQLQIPSVDGELHGRVVSWYETGQEEYEMNFYDGIEHGTFKEWDEEGNITSEKVYEMGELIK